jgi:hypothetical protein
MYIGVLGHELLHVRNELVYINDLQTAAGECEQVGFFTRSACETAVNNAHVNEGVIRNTFCTKEEDHVNFTTPISGERYNPPPAFGNPHQGNLPWPGMTPTPMPPSPVGQPAAGYEKPTGANICFN